MHHAYTYFVILKSSEFSIQGYHSVAQVTASDEDKTPNFEEAVVGDYLLAPTLNTKLCYGKAANSFVADVYSIYK